MHTHKPQRKWEIRDKTDVKRIVCKVETVNVDQV